MDLGFMVYTLTAGTEWPRWLHTVSACFRQWIPTVLPLPVAPQIITPCRTSTISYSSRILLVKVAMGSILYTRPFATFTPSRHCSSMHASRGP